MKELLFDNFTSLFSFNKCLREQFTNNNYLLLNNDATITINLRTDYI